ncbi:hypothetical protein CPB86DRAFT_805524 [Serendipita vermifera]|nr:hypothetical protein CPB86DRAFT_805524 [Serendipita vermifera]
MEPEGPNPTHILLRNIELPDRELSIEEQVKLRVGHLNQIHRISDKRLQPGVIQTRLTSGNFDTICDYLVQQLAEELESTSHDDDQERVCDLIGLALFKHPFLHNFPITISRILRSTKIVQPPAMFYRLHCFDWISKLASYPHIHTILRALVEVQRRNSSIKLLWRFEASDEEINTALTLVNAQERDEVSRFLQGCRRNPCLGNTMKAIDSLFSTGSDQAQQKVMMELLMKDLSRADPLLYKEFVDPTVKWTFRALQIPYIRLLACAMAGMDEELDQPDMAYITIPEWFREPMSDYILAQSPFTANPLTIERLRVRFWGQFSGFTRNSFIRQLLIDYDKMKLLEKVSQPDLGIDDGADFLLEITHTSFYRSVAESSIESLRVFSVAHLLTYQDQAFLDLETYKQDITPNKDCVKHLWELCNDIKKSPHRLARLLVRIAICELERSSALCSLNCIETYHDIITVVKRYYLTESGNSFDAQLYELANILSRHRDVVISEWDRLLRENPSRMDRLGSKEDFSVQCTEVIHGLTNHKSVAFGLCTSRTLACARPLVAHDAATGWLGMYYGERFKPDSSALGIAQEQNNVNNEGFVYEDSVEDEDRMDID